MSVSPAGSNQRRRILPLQPPPAGPGAGVTSSAFSENDDTMHERAALRAFAQGCSLDRREGRSAACLFTGRVPGPYVMMLPVLGGDRTLRAIRKLRFLFQGS